MCRGRHRTANVTGLQVVADRSAQICPALLPVPAKGRRGLRASQPEENRGRLGVERQGIARPPRALEMRERVLERMRGNLLLARHPRILYERRRSHQQLRACGVHGEVGGGVVDRRSMEPLERVQDGRMPSGSATRRGAVVERVSDQFVLELIPIIAAPLERLDERGLQSLIPGEKKALLPRLRQVPPPRPESRTRVR